MAITLFSCTLTGLEPSLVEVEVDISSGLPGFQIVGLPDSTVCEARDRIRSAIKNSGFEFPLNRMTINLAPADLRKEGSGFDLAMALGILKASGQLDSEKIEDFLIVGEVGLNGGVRSVSGVLAMAALLHKLGLKKMIVPFENLKEASVFEDFQIWPVARLSEAVSAVMGEMKPFCEKVAWLPNEEWPLDFCEVKGQEQAKRSLEIAAAGKHNLLFIGPPGSGKTMLAQRFPGILPPWTFEESLEISMIQSIAGLLQKEDGLLLRRPFRTPHSSMSYAGVVGGGNPLRPGELSFAHQGVLFLDELPEFHRNVLEALRQPLEEKRVTVVRLSGSVTYPANFLLVAAMNPCPCGYYGDLYRRCICRPTERLQYRKRLSGPLLDRIDLHVEVSRLPQDKLYRRFSPESSGEIRKRVMEARRWQAERFESLTKVNSEMDERDLGKYCKLSAEGENLLRMAYEKLHFSGRSYSKILKVARTIADLSQSKEVEILHLAEAMQYRILDRESLFE